MLLKAGRGAVFVIWLWAWDLMIIVRLLHQKKVC